MRNFVYALVFVSLLGFGFYNTLKSRAEGAEDQPTKFPYQLTEVKPSGSKELFSGQSHEIAPDKIIPDLSITLYLEDRISAFPDPKLGIGSSITIERAPVISIRDGKRSREYRSWVRSVSELFAEKKIELGADDKINTSLDAQISDGSQIIITRVAITNVVETKAIDFQTLEKEDPNLDYGKKRTEPGVKGEKKLTYRVRREDGEEVERTLLSTETTKQPKSQINYTGTKVTVLSSVSGKATMTPVSGYVVSPNYRRGTLIRITNRSNGVKIFATVNATWGTATPPPGVVLDLAPSFLSQLKCPSHGCSNVIVEEIKQ